MSFVLPHERRAMRLPTVPATLTALLEAMSDQSVVVPDAASRRGFLCRDAAYPLWMERSVNNGSIYLEASGSSTSWIIPTAPNKTIQLPVFDRITAFGGPTTVDGAAVTSAAFVDYGVLGDAPGGTAIYIPPGSTFCIRVYTGTAGGGSGLEAELASMIGGEEVSVTILLDSTVEGFIYTGTAGAAVSIGKGEGNNPVGFTWLRALRTGAASVTQANSPLLQLGWTTGGSTGNPSGTATVMLPVFNPPEFNNSTIPYSRTRLNSSAALFTNVGAALNKEGTILAARLKPTIVDPWSFTLSNVNSVHPKLRYFGPMEKGLYTFTTPSGNIQGFEDCRITMASSSTFNAVERPKFQYRDIGVYNAIIFQDLGSGSGSTQLAVSCYTHLEYETTSSLFSVGVSMHTLETLHAAEVALLSFGHFHENPLHWAEIARAAAAALAKVGPMVAPVIAHYGQKILNKGVDYLRGNTAAGDRSMPQARLVAQKPQRVAAKPKPKARSSKNQKKK